MMAQHQQTLPSLRDWDRNARHRADEDGERDKDRRSGVSTPDTTFPPTPGGSPPGVGASGNGNGSHLQDVKPDIKPLISSQEHHALPGQHDGAGPSYYSNPYGPPQTYSSYPLPSMHHSQPPPSQHGAYRASNGPAPYMSYSRYQPPLQPLAMPRMGQHLPPPQMGPSSAGAGGYYPSPSTSGYGPNGGQPSHPHSHSHSHAPLPHLQTQGRPYGYGADLPDVKPSTSPPPGRDGPLSMPPLGAGAGNGWSALPSSSSYSHNSLGRPNQQNPILSSTGLNGLVSHGFGGPAGPSGHALSRKRSHEWEEEEEGEEGDGGGSGSAEGSGDEEWREGNERSSAGKVKASTSASTSQATKTKKTPVKKAVRQSLEDLAAGREVVKTQEKKFICPHNACGRAFARNFNLQSHIKSHLGVRDFRCPECTKSFSRRHDCTRHCIAVHHYDKGTGKKMHE